MASWKLHWSSEALPKTPDPADPTIEVWRDPDGRIGALGERRGERLRLHLPDLATFEFPLVGDEVVVLASSTVRRETVEDQFFRTALPLVLQARGSEVLHASAVSTPEGVVALCAEKESGKSTLAYALSRRGHPLWADDAVTVEVEAGRAWTVALPFALRLRPASAAHFALAGKPTGGAAVRRVAATGAGGGRQPLRAVFVLSRLPPTGGVAAAVESRRLAASEAFTALLANAYCFTLSDAERKQAMMRHYLALVRDLPVFAVRYPTGLEHLEAILDAVERALASSPAAPVAAG